MGGWGWLRVGGVCLGGWGGFVVGWGGFVGGWGGVGMVLKTIETKANSAQALLNLGLWLSLAKMMSCHFIFT